VDSSVCLTELTGSSLLLPLLNNRNLLWPESTLHEQQIRELIKMQTSLHLIYVLRFPMFIVQTVVLWVVTPYSPLGGYWLFVNRVRNWFGYGGRFQPDKVTQIVPNLYISNPEDGGMMFLQNIGIPLQGYTMSQSTRPWIPSSVELIKEANNTLYRTVVFNLGYAYPRGYTKTS
jgi:hypothetical protein